MFDESDFKVWVNNPITQIIIKNLTSDINEFKERIINSCNFKFDSCLELYFNKGCLNIYKNIYETLNNWEEFKHFLDENKGENNERTESSSS